MNTTTLSTHSCILKVNGKHGLVFKARHPNRRYLKQMAEEILSSETTDYTRYEIHVSDHANEEMTEPEHLLHIDTSELSFNY